MMRKWMLAITLGAVAFLLTPVPVPAAVGCVCQDIGTPEDGQGECNVTSSDPGGLTARTNPAGGPCGTMNGLECNNTTFDAQILADTCGPTATSCTVTIQGNGPNSQYQETFTDADGALLCNLGPGSPLPVELVEFTVE